MIELIDFTVEFRSKSQVEKVLRNINLGLNQNTRLAILGLSGSGKSTVMKAISGQLPSDAQIGGKRSIKSDPVIHFFPQNPFDQFHPYKNLGWHIEETLRYSHARAAEKPISLSEAKALYLPEINAIESLYPYQLSGGQLLRFNLMVAALRKPDLLLADEPTASLDSESARDIAKILRETADRTQAGLVVATHDLEVGKVLADEAMLIDEGRAIANGDFSSVAVLYSKSFALDADIHSNVPLHSTSGEKIVTFENVNLGYSGRQPVIESVSLDLRQFSRILITGKSGSGKSTFLRSFFDDEVRIIGKATFHISNSDKKRARGKNLGVVFQDSWSTLSPKLNVQEILTETSKLAVNKPNLSDLTDWLRRAGLNSEIMQKLPHELSGGQRQRLSLLRAIIYRPKLLVLDEPTAYLDPKNTNLIVDLLAREVPMETSLLISSHKPSDFSTLCHQKFNIASARLQKIS